MPRHYHHLSLAERDRIFRLHDAKVPAHRIAQRPLRRQRLLRLLTSLSTRQSHRYRPVTPFASFQAFEDENLLANIAPDLAQNVSILSKLPIMHPFGNNS